MVATVIFGIIALIVLIYLWHEDGLGLAIPSFITTFLGLCFVFAIISMCVLENCKTPLYSASNYDLIPLADTEDYVLASERSKINGYIACYVEDGTKTIRFMPGNDTTIEWADVKKATVRIDKYNFDDSKLTKVFFNVIDDEYKFTITLPIGTEIRNNYTIYGVYV